MDSDARDFSRALRAQMKFVSKGGTLTRASTMKQVAAPQGYAPPLPPPVPTPAAQISKKRLKEMFETYKDEITVFAVRKKGAATHYSLEECPFNEGAHRDQKSSHKTDIIIRPTGATFKCQSDDCADYNFGDFLDLMEERTGIRFDPEDDEELAERWGGVECVAE